MRILHVISTLDPRAGGTTTALAGMAEAQAGVGLDVSIVATHREDFNDSVVQHLQSKGVTIHLIGPTKTALGMHPQIKPILSKLINEHGIVHIHAIWEEIQHRAARLAHQLGKPYIMSPHGMLDPWCLNQSKLKKKIYMALRLRKNLNRAAAMYFTTKTEHELVQPLNLSPPPIIEPLGLDLGEFEHLPASGTFRASHPELADRPMLLFLSRIHYKKGLDLLVPAFAKLSPAPGPDKVATAAAGPVLVIAGPDSEDGYKAKIERLAEQHGVADRVIFTGMLYGEKRIEAMVDADLFVLPSYQENFGIVVIEALAAGTPVVISDQVNLHHTVTEGSVGEVIPTDVNRLTDALNRWLADEAKRGAASDRARPHVWEHFDWKRIAERWIGHYEKVLRQHNA